MTNKTYSGFERAATCWTDQRGIYSVWRWWTCSSGLAQLSLLFGSRSSPLLSDSPSGYKTAPGWTVCSNLVPFVDVNVKGLQRSFESVLEALLLSTNWTFAICEFTKEQLFWTTLVRHACNMTSPTDLGSHRVVGTCSRLNTLTSNSSIQVYKTLFQFSTDNHELGQTTHKL